MTEQDAVRRFTTIYRECHARVYAYVVGRVGRALADDVVSEVFLVAWRRLEAVPPVPLPWLIGVARNVARERYRSEVRQAAVAAELGAWVDEAQADVADGVADRATVLAALARLSADDRELLTLVAWHDLDNRAAARVVGCSTATFFVRLHRARRRLERAVALVERETPAAERPVERAPVERAPVERPVERAPAASGTGRRPRTAANEEYTR